MCSCRSGVVGRCRREKHFSENIFVSFLLLYVQPGARLLSLHGGDGDPASRVVVDHPLVLVPEDVLRGQEGVLEDADERDESSLLYPVLVR